MQLEIKHTFDENSFRHFLNGHGFVLHCHHYMGLSTKLAEDYAAIGGTTVLREVAEDSLRPVLDSYIAENGISGAENRLAVGAAYYTTMGMGTMSISGTATGGEVTLEASHVDEGWVKKFGASDKPINHFTCGFVAAVFAAAFDKPARSFEVAETASAAAGAGKTTFAVKAL